MENKKGHSDICCPPFDPAPWEDKIIEWNNKKFIKDNVSTFFFMPMNFGKIMRRLDHKIRNAGISNPDNMCLSYHTSKWNMEVYLAVEKHVPGEEIILKSGKFYSKVYEGDFKDTGKWCKDYENSAKTKSLKIKKMFMWYTTCPKCAKKYGKNYTVIISEVE